MFVKCSMRKILTFHKFKIGLSTGLIILGTLFLIGVSTLTILALGSVLVLAGIIWAGAYEEEGLGNLVQSE